ncbi:MAG TPA: hypothetical protein VGL27_19050 [Negativicutes bacterium]|jgi:hypothetical protein
MQPVRKKSPAGMNENSVEAADCAAIVGGCFFADNLAWALGTINKSERLP